MPTKYSTVYLIYCITLASFRIWSSDHLILLFMSCCLYIDIDYSLNVDFGSSYPEGLKSKYASFLALFCSFFCFFLFLPVWDFNPHRNYRASPYAKQFRALYLNIASLTEVVPCRVGWCLRQNIFICLGVWWWYIHIYCLFIWRQSNTTISAVYCKWRFLYYTVSKIKYYKWL